MVGKCPTPHWFANRHVLWICAIYRIQYHCLHIVHNSPYFCALPFNFYILLRIVYLFCALCMQHLGTLAAIKESADCATHFGSADPSNMPNCRPTIHDIYIQSRHGTGIYFYLFYKCTCIKISYLLCYTYYTPLFSNTCYGNDVIAVFKCL